MSFFSDEEAAPPQRLQIQQVLVTATGGCGVCVCVGGGGGSRSKTALKDTPATKLASRRGVKQALIASHHYNLIACNRNQTN